MATTTDNQKTFHDALEKLKAQEAQGKKTDTLNTDWGKIYATLINPDISAEASAKLALEAAIALKPGGRDYDLIWSAFHNDIDKLEKDKKYDAASRLLGSAVDAGYGLSGIRDESDAKTVENLSLLSDDKLAMLSAADRKTLEDQFADAAKSLTSVPDYDSVEEKRTQYAEQLDRLKKEDAKDAVQNAGVAIPEVWNKINADRFFADLQHYSGENLPGATNLLADVMTGSIKDSPWKDDARATFTDYVARLSNSSRDNEEQNIGVADRAMKRIYDQLPPEDAYRKTLESMAIGNGYDLAKGKQFAPPVEAEDSRPERQPPRYEVSDSGSMPASHLPVPGARGAHPGNARTYLC